MNFWCSHVLSNTNGVHFCDIFNKHSTAFPPWFPPCNTEQCWKFKNTLEKNEKNHVELMIAFPENNKNKIKQVKKVTKASQFPSYLYIFQLIMMGMV